KLVLSCRVVMLKRRSCGLGPAMFHPPNGPPKSFRSEAMAVLLQNRMTYEKQVLDRREAVASSQSHCLATLGGERIDSEGANRGPSAIGEMPQSYGAAQCDTEG